MVFSLVEPYDLKLMARGTAQMIPLGYGKYVRADRVYALVPLEGGQRGDGRRTLVHVEGIEEPIVASRSEIAIARDVALALGQPGPGRRDAAGMPGQEALF
jgi:hypothetical protein